MEQNSLESPKNTKNKKRAIYMWLLGVVILVGAVLSITNPFSREQNQVEQLRTMGQEEQQNYKAAQDVNAYISNERALKNADQSLKNFESSSTSGTTTP